MCPREHFVELESFIAASLRQKEEEQNECCRRRRIEDFPFEGGELDEGAQKNTKDNIDKQKYCLRTSGWDEGLYAQLKRDRTKLAQRKNAATLKAWK